MTDKEIQKHIDEAVARATDGPVDQPGSRRWWEAQKTAMEARLRGNMPVDDDKEKYMAKIAGMAADSAAREVAKDVTGAIRSEMAALRAEIRGDNQSEEDTDEPMGEVRYRRLRDDLNRLDGRLYRLEKVVFDNHEPRITALEAKAQ